eukprot:jgi/Galph1/4988/GphlegSOOS_G3665.1
MTRDYEETLNALIVRVREEQLFDAFSDDKLVKRIKDCPENERIILKRFLIARKFNEQAALDSFRACLEFRRDEAVNSISFEEFKDTRASFPFLWTGFYTFSGEPLLYCKACVVDRYRMELAYFHRAFISFVEFLEETVEPERRFVVLYDFTNFSPVRNVHFGCLADMLKVLQSYYPERLSKIFIVNYSRTIYGLYKLVSPWIDENTRAKLEWVENKDYLRRFLKDHMIPEALGGTARYQVPGETS